MPYHQPPNTGDDLARLRPPFVTDADKTLTTEETTVNLSRAASFYVVLAILAVQPAAAHVHSGALITRARDAFSLAPSYFSWKARWKLSRTGERAYMATGDLPVLIMNSAGMPRVISPSASSLSLTSSTRILAA